MNLDKYVTTVAFRLWENSSPTHIFLFCKFYLMTLTWFHNEIKINIVLDKFILVILEANALLVNLNLHIAQRQTTYIPHTLLNTQGQQRRWTCAGSPWGRAPHHAGDVPVHPVQYGRVPVLKVSTRSTQTVFSECTRRKTSVPWRGLRNAEGREIRDCVWMQRSFFTCTTWESQFQRKVFPGAPEKVRGSVERKQDRLVWWGAFSGRSSLSGSHTFCRCAHTPHARMCTQMHTQPVVWEVLIWIKNPRRPL